MSKKKIRPSELELLLLKVLWNGESADETPLAVREVRERLAAKGRDLAHTSVLSTLNVMLEKKMVTRSPRKNAFVYAPRVSEPQVHRNEVGSLLDRVFDGSAENLMSALLKTKRLNAAAIAEIKRLIEEAEQ